MPFVIHTLSDRVHEYLRERIVTHEIAPGEPIRQDALAEELGVSKIPVREALARLVEANLVQALANKGFVATPLSLEELEELFALRALLEPNIAALTAKSAELAQRGQVKSAKDAMIANTGSYRETTNLRRLTILSMLQQPGRKTTMSILMQLFDRAERYHPEVAVPAFTDAGNLKSLVAAWLKGDSAKVSELYRARLATRLELSRHGLQRQTEGNARIHRRKI